MHINSCITSILIYFLIMQHNIFKCIFFVRIYTADHDVDLDTRMQLMSLSHANDPNVLVIAAAAGDVSTMRSFLAGAPDKVLINY